MPDDSTLDVKAAGKEQTGTQAVVISSGWRMDATTPNPLPVSYDTYRIIRRHPTIALARALSAAPVIAGKWSIDADDDASDEAMSLIRDEVMPKRADIVGPAMYGGIDFGWQGFELVYGNRNGTRTGLDEAKQLLQDLTTILADAKTGKFAGYKQSPTSGTSVTLRLPYTLHIGFRVEGTQWYGQSLLENARLQYNQWIDANDGAARYDAKLAGSHFYVEYPVGTTPYTDGIATDNIEIAQDILDALESSGNLIIPRQVEAFVAEMNGNMRAENAWKVGVIEDKGGRQPTFVERLKYLDALLVRALLMPERVGLEGQFGTKAEAGEHKDLWFVILEQLHESITRQVNTQVVDRLLHVNFGQASVGTVRLTPGPLADVDKSFLQAVYEKIMSGQMTSLEEFPTIDTDSLKDRLAIPKAVEDTSREAAMPGLTPAQLDALQKQLAAMRGEGEGG